MNKTIRISFISTLLFFNVLAGPACPGVPAGPEVDTADLSSKIGSTMFAYYQFNYHDQLVIATTLRCCGVEDVANKVIDSVPDLPSFYLKQSSQQLLYDIIYKEAMVSGYDLEGGEDFDLVSKQSLIMGQSYFSGYLKGYQIAMQNFLDARTMEPFCQAAIDEADKFIGRKATVTRSR